MRIPLTLAIMTALVVTRSGETYYAIPQATSWSSCAWKGQSSQDRSKMIGDAAVYRLRGELLPLVWLDHQLTSEGSDGTGRASAGRSRSEAVDIVVMQADDLTFGLIVDDVIDTQEIVVKPLGQARTSESRYSPAPRYGKRPRVLILDVRASPWSPACCRRARRRASDQRSLEAELRPGKKRCCCSRGRRYADGDSAFEDHAARRIPARVDRTPRPSRRRAVLRRHAAAGGRCQPAARPSRNRAR